MRALKFAVFWAVFFLIVGFYEEFFTRGYTQFTLTEAVGFWPAAILLSLGFGALHLENPGESWVGILGAMVIGFFFCLTLRRTGNLWFAIGFHASWDWGESYFYSVPDSGGMAPGHLLHSSLQGPRWLTGGSVGPGRQRLSLRAAGAAVGGVRSGVSRSEVPGRHFRSLKNVGADVLARRCRRRRRICQLCRPVDFTRRRARTPALRESLPRIVHGVSHYLLAIGCDGHRKLNRLRVGLA